MERVPEMQSFLDKFTKQHFGITDTEAGKRSICVFCKKKVDPKTEFEDELSRKEWNISRLCALCQSDVFSKPNV